MDALRDLSEVDGAAGGKAHGLARLAALGLPVPPALVLTTDAYVRWLETGRVAEEDARALGRALERLGTPVAVRSSALDEDAADRSAAGQYESVMGVRTPAEAVAAAAHCFRAATSERAVAYRGRSDTALALVVQREVAASRAGVAFSIDPVTGDGSELVIEAAFGHGERIVSGLVAPDRYRVERDTGRVRARIAEKDDVAPARRVSRTLRDDEARGVADLVLAAERGFGGPVDVEFCFEGGTLWLVQCRPITTLDARA